MWQTGVVPVAVVTGAGQGLGRAVALRLARDGFDIVAVDIDAKRAGRTAEEVGGSAAVLDVRDFEAVEAMAATFERVDALINNAGIWHKRSLQESSVAELRDVIDVNVVGTVLMTKALAPLLAQSPTPAIVNVSSVAAALSSPDLGTYPASKAAVESLTRQWAVELAPIRVNAVGPGLIVTEGTRSNYEGSAGELRAKAVPLGRVGAPADVADVVAFLVGDQARYVSGQIVYVDGGLSAGTLPR